MSELELNIADLVPPAEIAARNQRLQQRLQQRELPLAVVTHRVDLYYLAGAMPDAFLVARADGDPIFLVRKSQTRTAVESPLSDQRPSRGLGTLIDLLRELTGDRPTKVGIDLDVLPAATYLRLTQSLPHIQWQDTGKLMRGLRATKSAWEIARQETAARQVEAGYRAAMDVMREGVSETELSVAVEGAMRKTGHHGLVRLRRPGLELYFPHIAFGASSAHPVSFDGPVGGEGLHPASGGGAGRRALQRNETLMLDLVGIDGGYVADIARLFCLGEPSDATRRAHDFCREALHRIEKLLVPGTPWGEVYAQVDDWAKQNSEPEGFMGYGENRVKFFGHGVGLELDEWPIIARGFKQPLEVGHVVAVEPKAFTPALGPAGLENTYVIEENGPRSLIDWTEEITSVS